jgi:pimeloyl-ACP methyl ester carboxylesterase
MSTVTHRSVQANGISIHLAEAGDGPAVILLHGFPELWYSWRHQLPALADAGYHAIAPDLRGYGRTAAPPAVEDYAMVQMVADVTGVLDVLGLDHAVVAGHDWGANIAWAAAQAHPDRITAVAALSVPLQPRTPEPPVEMMRRMAANRFNWALYFQEPGVAEAELEQDVTRTLRLTLYALSGDAPEDLAARLLGGLPADSRLLDPIPEPGQLPGWLTAGDLAYYAAEFGRTGFTGALNRYRNLDRDWADLGRAGGLGAASITQPALFLGGGRDTATRFVDHKPMNQAAAQLRSVIIPGCGHWIQQERPDVVNDELIAFLRQNGRRN